MGEDKKETIKDMLESYHDIEGDIGHIESEIKNKEYALKNLKNMTKDASTSNYSPISSQRDFYVEGSNELFICNKDERERKLNDEIELLQAEKNMIIAKRGMIDGYINGLKPIAKQIIELCYKSQWTEQQIADHLNMSLGGVQDNKKASFKKMQEKYDKNVLISLNL